MKQLTPQDALKKIKLLSNIRINQAGKAALSALKDNPKQEHAPIKKE